MFLDDDDEVCLFGFSSDVAVAVIVVVVVVSIGSLLLLNFPPDLSIIKRYILYVYFQDKSDY